MAKTVVGLYEDRSIADRVVKDLESSGFDRKSIQTTHGSIDQTSTLNSLQSAGVPREDAQFYVEGIRHGATLVTVDSPDRDAGQAASIMDRFDPIDMESRAGDWGLNSSQSTQTQDRASSSFSGDRPTRTTGTSGSLEDEGEVTLPVTEERMQVGKRREQTGGARIRTYVTETPVEQDVNLRRERVEVERNPVDRPATEADLNAFQEGTLEVTESAERPVVSKEARVVEEVKVRKDVEEQSQTVRDTVRRTNVEAEDMGQTWSGQGDRFRSYDTYEPDYRKHFQSSYRGSKVKYDDYQPAYRYGYNLATSDQYQGRDWSEIEPEVRRNWERQNPGSAWDKFKGAVREAWDSVTNS